MRQIARWFGHQGGAAAVSQSVVMLRGDFNALQILDHVLNERTQRAQAVSEIKSLRDISSTAEPLLILIREVSY